MIHNGIKNISKKKNSKFQIIHNKLTLLRTTCNLKQIFLLI